MERKRRVISLLVDNQSGVLARVSSLFCRRGFNIDSLTVSATNDPTVSRITVTITSGGLGTMGFGYGAAIGAQMALGRDQRVVMFTGDGSFHMNLNEACTAVSYELPIITVIFNNQVLGMVRQWQTAFYGKRFSQTDPHRKTDFVKLAEGFGLKGYRCTNLAEFQTAFAEALKNKGPTWIECMIDKDEKVLPMIPGGGDINDIIMK